MLTTAPQGTENADIGFLFLCHLATSSQNRPDRLNPATPPKRQLRLSPPSPSPRPQPLNPSIAPRSTLSHHSLSALSSHYRRTTKPTQANTSQHKPTQVHKKAGLFQVRLFALFWFYLLRPAPLRFPPLLIDSSPAFLSPTFSRISSRPSCQCCASETPGRLAALVLLASSIR